MRDQDAVDWCLKSLAAPAAPYWLNYVDLASSYAWLGRDGDAKSAVRALLLTVPTHADVTNVDADPQSDTRWPGLMPRVLLGDFLHLDGTTDRQNGTRKLKQSSIAECFNDPTFILDGRRLQHLIEDCLYCREGSTFVGLDQAGGPGNVDCHNRGEASPQTARARFTHS